MSDFNMQTDWTITYCGMTTANDEKTIPVHVSAISEMIKILNERGDCVVNINRA